MNNKMLIMGLMGIALYFIFKAIQANYFKGLTPEQVAYLNGLNGGEGVSAGQIGGVDTSGSWVDY